MTLFIGSFGVISIIFGLIFSLSVLNSKPLISQAFFTDEQKLKVYLYNLTMFSIFLSITGVFLFIIWNTSLIGQKTALDSTVLGQGLGIAIITFLTSVFVVDRAANLVQNFRIKYHYKLRINMPSVGYIYLIGMLD